MHTIWLGVGNSTKTLNGGEMLTLNCPNCNIIYFFQVNIFHPGGLSVFL